MNTSDSLGGERISESPCLDSRVVKILDILIKDYESMRAEIRAAETRHEKVTFWLSSGLLVVAAGCYKDFKIGFAFIPLIILAYYAHRLYSHELHVAILSRWIMRIEDLVDRILATKGLLDWERTFVRQRLKTFSAKSVLSPHYLTECVLLLPSIVVFFISLYYGAVAASCQFGIPNWLARLLIWGGYPALLVALCVLFFSLSGGEELEKAREESVMRTYLSIVPIDNMHTKRKEPESNAVSEVRRGSDPISPA